MVGIMILHITPSPRKAARFNTDKPIRLNIINRKFISEESRQELDVNGHQHWW